MNVKECANCRLHGWKQLENQDDLLTCKRCKVIQYCGKDCQTEHWKKLHKSQCKYLADPAKAHQAKHSEEAYVICLRTAGVGKCEIRNPNTPNYECFYKSPEWQILMVSDLYHDHPFPVSGQPGNNKEKVGMVMWNLVQKFRHSQPTVFLKFRDELKEILLALLLQRLHIWQSGKIYPQPEYICNDNTVVIEPHVNHSIKECISLADPFELWKTIDVVHKIGLDEYRPTHYLAQLYSGPRADGLQQTCSLCSKQIIITGIGFLDHDGPVVYFDNLFMGMFVCGVGDCSAKKYSMTKDLAKFGKAMVSATAEREATRCDFCFLLSPADDVHRCSRCCTTMYCSKTCQLEDWKIHKEVCKEEEEKRKIKFGEVVRKEEAREARNELKETVGPDSGVNEACEMLEHFEFNKAQKKSKKKSK